MNRLVHFKFENAWLCEPEVDDVVREGWSMGNLGDVQSHLRGCAMALVY